MDMADKLHINKHDLDNELVSQPSLYWELSENYISLAAIRDQKKSDLESVEATLDSQVRLALDKVGDKVTEAKVRCGIQTDPARVAALTSFYKAKEDAEKAQALVEAARQRSYMLRDLVTLHVSGYYSDSALSADSSAVGETVAKARASQLREQRASTKERLQATG